MFLQFQNIIRFHITHLSSISTEKLTGSSISVFSFSVGFHHTESHSRALCSNAQSHSLSSFYTDHCWSFTLNNPMYSLQHPVAFMPKIMLCGWIQNQCPYLLHGFLISNLHLHKVLKMIFAACQTVPSLSSHPLIFYNRSKYYNRWGSWT